MPAPVSVTVLPDTVAGPLATWYEIVPSEAEPAIATNGDVPNVSVGIGTKTSVGVIGVTVNKADELETDPAALLTATATDIPLLATPIEGVVYVAVPTPIDFAFSYHW